MYITPQLNSALNPVGFCWGKKNLSDYIKGQETIKLNVFKLCMVENF